MSIKVSKFPLFPLYAYINYKKKNEMFQSKLYYLNTRIKKIYNLILILNILSV